jgi:hypothetical protein
VGAGGVIALSGFSGGLAALGMAAGSAAMLGWDALTHHASGPGNCPPTKGRHASGGASSGPKFYGLAPALGALLSPLAKDSFGIKGPVRFVAGGAFGLVGSFGPGILAVGMQHAGMSKRWADVAGYSAMGAAGIGALALGHHIGGRLGGYVELAGFSAGLSAAAMGIGTGAVAGCQALAHG